MSEEAAGPLDRETIKERFAYWWFSGMERAGMRWPERVGHAVFRAYASVMFHMSTNRRAVVARNLSQILGQPPESELVQAAVKEAFALYGQFWFDGFHARVMPPEEVNKRFVIENLANVDRALEEGRGAILALPHMGNWDVAGRFLCVNGYRMVAAAEELRPRSVYELFLRHREALGMKIVPLTADRSAGQKLAECLWDNWVVTLVADRDLGGRGVDVEMFGRTRKLPAGPALLSIKTGSPLMACPVYTTDDGWYCRIGERLLIEPTGETRVDVTALTRLLAREFERDIAAKPVDWHMFQPAWEDEPAREDEPASA